MSNPIKLPEGAWVLVADGEKALFMRNVTDAQDPMFEIVREKKQDNPPDREQGTDSPGRKADTGVGQRSAMEETDWHQIAKERFADEIAERLYKYAHAGRFDRPASRAARGARHPRPALSRSRRNRPPAARNTSRHTCRDRYRRFPPCASTAPGRQRDGAPRWYGYSHHWSSSAAPEGRGTPPNCGRRVRSA